MISYSESEKALMGCLILEPELMEEAEGYGLETKHLQEMEHKDIWTLIKKAEKEGIDFDSVYLVDNGLDRDYVMDLMDSVVSTANFRTYAHNTALGWFRQNLATKMDAEGDDFEGISAMIDAFNQMFAGTETPDLSEIATEATESILSEDSIVEIAWPWKSFNIALGGLRRGKLIFLGGRPGHHKTNLAVNVSAHVATQGFNVLYCDYEMGELETFQRHVAVHKNVTGSYMSTKRDGYGRKLDEGYRQAIAEDIRQTVADMGGNLHIATYPKLHEIKALVKAKNIDLVIVDHIQVFSMNQPKRSDESNAGHINQLCAKLKRMALEENICIVSPSQIDRNCDGPPKKNAFKESAGIEENGDVLIGIWWPHAEGRELSSKGERCDMNYYEIEFAKNRGGPQIRVELFVNPATGKIKEPDPVDNTSWVDKGEL